MKVLVQGVGPVPCRVADMGLTLQPDKPIEVEWAQALKLADRRLASVRSFADTRGFVREVAGHPALYWLSPFSQGDGYATAAESMVYWLLQAGAKLSVHYSWFLVEDGLRPETLRQLKAPLANPMLIGVCMATPGEFEKLPTPYKIGFTMYESTNPLRVYPEWRHQCNAVDRLFVPSKYCKDVFGQFADVPIDVVPLAIHEGYCKPVKRQQHDVFTVVTFATLTGRKSPLEMIEVFQRAFPTERDVRFVLKTRLDLLGSKHPGLPDDLDDPRIIVYSDTWPWRRVAAMLYKADCMLFLSKGEGFGMTPREAMATGLPVVLADNTGMSDVCDDRYNWPVPTHHVEDSPLGGVWDVPDWDYAVDVLRDIYEHRDDAYEKAYGGGLWYVREHGPERAAAGFLKTLEGIRKPDKACKFKQESLSRQEQLPTVPIAVRKWIVERAGPFVQLDGYGSVYSLPLNGNAVLLGQAVMALTNEQVTYVVNFVLNQGAKAVVIAVPSVYQPANQWPAARKWRIEELQHVLKGMSVPHLYHVLERTWIAAVIVQPNGSRLQGFGTVVDRRWKPT